MVGPVDGPELLQRALTIIPQQDRGYYQRGRSVVLALAGGPRQPILRPSEIENPAFQEELQQAALFGQHRAFALTHTPTLGRALRPEALSQDGATPRETLLAALDRSPFRRIAWRDRYWLTARRHWRLLRRGRLTPARGLAFAVEEQTALAVLRRFVLDGFWGVPVELADPLEKFRRDAGRETEGGVVFPDGLAIVGSDARPETDGWPYGVDRSDLHVAN